MAASLLSLPHPTPIPPTTTTLHATGVHCFSAQTNPSLGDMMGLFFLDQGEYLSSPPLLSVLSLQASGLPWVAERGAQRHCLISWTRGRSLPPSRLAERPPPPSKMVSPKENSEEPNTLHLLMSFSGWELHYCGGSMCNWAPWPSTHNRYSHLSVQSSLFQI